MNIPADAKSRLRWGIVFPLIGIALIWAVHLLELVWQTEWNRWGVMPRTFEGLRGIITMPFLHGDLSHLTSNSTALFVLGFVMINLYPKTTPRVLLAVWLLGGLVLWIIGRQNYHIGASGIVYGMAAYLFFMGLLRWEPRSMAVALFVAFLYGSLVWGLFPIWTKTSWEGHLAGALTGTLAAFLFWNREPLDRPPDDHHDEETDLPYWMYEEEGGLKRRDLPPSTDVS